MIVPRETIYAALWAKGKGAVHPVTGLPAFITADRRLRHFNQVSPAEQPALFMALDRETPQQTKGVPPRWDLTLQFYVYDNQASDPAEVPGTRMSYLLDALDHALAPNALGYQTLGGLVSHCWISGAIDIYEGYRGIADQSVAIVPISIRVPDASGPGY